MTGSHSTGGRDTAEIRAAQTARSPPRARGRLRPAARRRSSGVDVRAAGRQAARACSAPTAAARRRSSGRCSASWRRCAEARASTAAGPPTSPRPSARGSTSRVSALDVALMGSLRERALVAAGAARPIARRPHAALERVGLANRAGDRFGELSGGQRQRVLLARALVQDARVLLLDEPLAGVDPASGERIEALFGELRDEGRTLLVSTHDVDSARALRPRALPQPRARSRSATRPTRSRAPCSSRPTATRSWCSRTAPTGRCARSPSSTTTTEMDLLGPLQSGIDQPRAARGRRCSAASAARSVSGSRPSGSATPAESLAHGLLPGLVVAALAGVPLLVGGVAGVLVAALAIALAGRDPRVGSETATAVAVTGLLGLGGAAGAQPRRSRAARGAAVRRPARRDRRRPGRRRRAGAARLRRAGRAAPPASAPWRSTPPARRSLGIRPTLVRLALLGLLAAALAVAVQGLGSLLVLAILVAPAVAVRGHVRSPGRAMVASGVTAVVAGVAGIWASHLLGTAAGASVALALCARGRDRSRAARSGSDRRVRRAAAQSRQPVEPAEDHRRADQLRLGQSERSRRRCGG